MQIERVTARAFGPFRGRSLDFAPGLTVVSGPNESGKSSWHAATRVALCGMRRGRGAGTSDDREFAARHRPWDDPERWEVEARVSLNDGRTVDISQDLAGKVACRAVEVGLGRDVSDEILDGTPDASRWLGLDRDAFAATICVNQAQIHSVGESAGMLQEHMQRAAATRGTDATAAEAIERLTAFRREAIGVDRENARGPLRAAKNRLASSKDELDQARRQHAEYIELGARLEVAERTATEAQTRLMVVEAALAETVATRARIRADRARDLAARHPSAPATSAARDVAADIVAAALAGWAHRPNATPLEGSTVEELERELERVPPLPDGDIQQHSSVVEARREAERAADALAFLAAQSDEAGRGDGAPEPRQRAARWRLVGLVAAGAIGVVGIVMLSLGVTLAGAGAMVVALALAAWMLVGAQRGALSHPTERGRQAHADLQRRRAGLESRLVAANAVLHEELEARGTSTAPDPLAAAMRYESECRTRSEQAAAAGRAEPLRKAIAARRAAEQGVAEAAAALAASAAALTDAARATGVATDSRTPDDLVEELEQWRRRRADQARLADEAMAEWQELQSLLAGATVRELEEQASDLTARAARLVAEIGARPPALPSGDLESLRDELRGTHEVARRQADELSGGLEVLSRQLPDVAEAEEALAATQAELHRVQALATTLDHALVLLRSAEERVHRDLAPVLAESIGRWLPRVCAGRYVDVTVDPADLAVKVKEAHTGQWREARLLSQGTREQIYLLLRVAMAQHLVTNGETAPLLLDEVTAQSDAERTVQLLEVVHLVSEERQVILFSHDPLVASWAETLSAPADALVRLSSLGATLAEETSMAHVAG